MMEQMHHLNFWPEESLEKSQDILSIKEYDVSVKKNSLGEIISSAKAEIEVDGEKISLYRTRQWSS